MGRPKAWLPFGEETLLARTVRLLHSVVTPVAVVAAPGQDLPQLADDVLIVRDEQEGDGPLAGMAAGLAALQTLVEAAYVSSCDVPLLRTRMVESVIDRLGEYELVIPRQGKYHHPLAGVYRTALAPRCRELITAGQRRPLHLVQASRSLVFDVQELTAVDPDLESFRNANTPEEYTALLALAGYDLDQSNDLPGAFFDAE